MSFSISSNPLISYSLLSFCFFHISPFLPPMAAFNLSLHCQLNTAVLLLSLCNVSAALCSRLHVWQWTVTVGVDNEAWTLELPTRAGWTQTVTSWLITVLNAAHTLTVPSSVRDEPWVYCVSGFIITCSKVCGHVNSFSCMSGHWCELWFHCTSLIFFHDCVYCDERFSFFFFTFHPISPSTSPNPLWPLRVWLMSKHLIRL